MSAFDSKLFNAQVFNAYMDTVPRTRLNKLLEAGVIRDRTAQLAPVFAEQAGGNYMVSPMFGLIEGTPDNYDGNTNINASPAKTYSQGKIVVGRARGWTEKDFSADITGVNFLDEVAKQGLKIGVVGIPKTIDKYQVVVWRTQVREELSIPDDYTVYCYIGSFKPWQCAKETIESFSFQYFKDKKSFMLVLTQDQEPFENELKRLDIPKSNYIIKNVKPEELYKYMSAANFGFLLREQDIINWVSRPTKMLEYQACGLQIIHNNTIAWLAKN